MTIARYTAERSPSAIEIMNPKNIAAIITIGARVMYAVRMPENKMMISASMGAITD